MLQDDGNDAAAQAAVVPAKANANDALEAGINASSGPCAHVERGAREAALTEKRRERAKGKKLCEKGSRFGSTGGDTIFDAITVTAI